MPMPDNTAEIARLEQMLAMSQRMSRSGGGYTDRIREIEKRLAELRA